ncbi:MFS transporter [Streptomyces sp. enrichment culture]|uniref:MFS transporter n=1 Tax=Streptomyces sp. enrichment culture TaxID=1795815 RepID=UPI003F54CD86
MNTDASRNPGAGAGTSPGKDPLPGDLVMARALWPVLLASAVGLLPFTVFSTYLVPIADRAGSGVAAVGGLRGLGGLAALLVGTALAPFLDRVRRDRAAAGALVVLGASAALGASGDFVLLAAFCLLVGASTAVLNPALTAAAADRYGDGPAAGRAATLVTATQSMTAMLAAPAVALPALLWGWQGDLLAVAAACLVLAAVVLTRGRREADGDRPGAEAARHPGYLASFRGLVAVPGAVPLLLVSLLRTAVFMGYLAYLAAHYDERFGLGPAVFALVWTLSGTAYFVSNLLTGRITNSATPRLSTERLLVVGLLTSLASVVAFYATDRLPLALALTALHAASHAVVAACAVSLLVRRCGARRGAALSLNAAGQSLGVFAGAALGGAGLALAGDAGIATVFGALVAVALGAALLVVRTRPDEPEEQDQDPGRTP